MIQIHDVDGARKVSLGYVPDPDGAIADHDFLLRQAPATPPSFRVYAVPEVFGGFDRPGVAAGVLVADRPALFVLSGLGEDTTEFCFASWVRLALYLSPA